MSSVLDSRPQASRIDRGGMLSMIEKTPENLVEAYRLAARLEIPGSIEVGGRTLNYRSLSSVVVAGMGGSAIGGDIVRDLTRDILPIPLTVSRGYSLPGFARGDTLVVAVSYSGNTEETISCFIEAVRKGCPVIAVASGGLLGDMASSAGVPFIRVPQGYQPRAALPFLMVPLLVVLEKFELVKNVEEWVKEAAEAVAGIRDKLGFDTPYEENPLKKLAAALQGRIPAIYAYWPYRSAGLRFKTQLNENSKVLARFEELPEQNHNEIMGWEKSDVKPHAAVFLRGSEERVEVGARVEFMEAVLRELGVPVYELRAREGCRLSEILSLIYQGDLVSYYLALLNRVDPTPVGTIQRLKKHLAEKVSTLERLRKEFSKTVGR